MTTWVLDAGWKRPPLSMNDRLNHWRKAELTTLVRSTACLLARAAKIPPQQHITIQMVWTVPTRARRDEENPVATLKAFCDGLAAPVGKAPGALIVPDDTPAYMTKHMPRIEYRKGESAVRFEISNEATACQCRPEEHQ